VAELKYILGLMKPDHIWFADDIFGLKPGWTQRFADLIEVEGSNSIKSLNRVDLLLQGDTIPALKRRARIRCGSARRADRRRYSTRWTRYAVEDIYAATRRLQAEGIRVAFFLQFGYLGEPART